ncbi:hypothetical protein ES703_112824 [subsurface metagenome]
MEGGTGGAYSEDITGAAPPDTIKGIGDAAGLGAPAAIIMDDCTGGSYSKDIAT